MGSVSPGCSTRNRTDDATEGLASDDGLLQMDEVASIQHLVGGVRNQDDYERDIEIQANQAITEAGDQRDRLRIERLEAKKTKLKQQREVLRATTISAFNQSSLRRSQAEIARLDVEIREIDQEISNFTALIDDRHKDVEDDPSAEGGAGKLPHETQREFLIRTGKITPFAPVSGSGSHGPEEDDGQIAAQQLEDEEANVSPARPRKAAGLSEDPLESSVSVPASSTANVVESEFSLRPRKRRKVYSADSEDEFTPASPTSSPENDHFKEEVDSDDLLTTPSRPTNRKKKTRAQVQEIDGDVLDLRGVDDGDETAYRERLARWEEKERLDGLNNPARTPDHVLTDGLRIPGKVYASLFNWQKTGVQWLAELYSQSTGGILGDEMGLGKTIQVIAFVAALHHSKQLANPVIIVAPATLLKQWANEFHRWWPPLRVSILHASGSGMMNAAREEELEDDSALDSRVRKASPAAKRIVDRVVKDGHVLVTTYAGLKANHRLLLPINWQYAVLDEGHKIRNPNAALTLSCKGLRTRNRLILSGTPMQNNLQELWSLFDFVCPMRLGTLFDFRNNFEMAINRGGYKNASYVEVKTSEKCAETLKDAIMPYLLRRFKSDVSADLPRKTEQVLFCKLTQAQSDAYKKYLASETVDAILSGKAQQMVGIDHLRKICNHPDLVRKSQWRDDPSYEWGRVSRSGKMAVARHLLRLWKRDGHKALLFSQGRQMLNILENMVKKERGMGYLRMDGQTPITARQGLVDAFNTNPGLDVFLLTTRVGGLGVNLTGANRVIIFDPDWNPANDIQARERAWRLGQTRDVTIYRLCTAGTIEEKIYQRQIFKQALANRVLKDPKQRGVVFAQNELRDLFSLGSYDNGTTETAELLHNTPGNVFQQPTARRSVIAPGSDAYLIAGGQGAQRADSGDTGRTTTSAPARPPADSGRDDSGQIKRFAGVTALDDYMLQDEPAPPAGDRIMHDILSDKVHARMATDGLEDGYMVNETQRAMMDYRATKLAEEATASLTAPLETIPSSFEGFDAAASLGGVDARRARAGPSSTSIVARLADSQGIRSAAPASNRSSPAGGIATPPLEPRPYVQDVLVFLRRRGIETQSNTITEHFGQYVTTVEEKRQLRAALHHVATLDEGLWTLKPKFRSPM